MPLPAPRMVETLEPISEAEVEPLQPEACRHAIPIRTELDERVPDIIADRVHRSRC